MSYTLSFDISLGSGKAGLTLAAQLVDTSGNAVGSEITTGFTEIGGGTYLLVTSIPDDFRGGIKVYESGHTDVLGFCAINPEEAENTNDILKDTGDILEDTGTTIPGQIDGLNDLSAADVWSYSIRTLTQPASQVADAMKSGKINIYRGDTFTVTITGLGDISQRSKLYWTVKKQLADQDASAIIQIEETGGLLRLNGETSTASNGKITVTNATNGDIKIELSASATKKLAITSIPHKLHKYDVQAIMNDGSVKTLSVGDVKVTGDVTRTV